MIASVGLMILVNFPRPHFQEIFLQQDNAALHRILEDQDDIDAFASIRGEITLLSQPANSLVLNVFDLGFFKCKESLQTRPNSSAGAIDDLINASYDAFDRSESITRDNV